MTLNISKDIEKIYKQIKIFTEQFEILYDNPVTLMKWRDLIEYYNVKGKSVYDCNIIATMLTNDIHHIFTNDDDFKRYNNLVTVIPLKDR
jgi:predicted nucleic acid-binding protein